MNPNAVIFVPYECSLYYSFLYEFSQKQCNGAPSHLAVHVWYSMVSWIVVVAGWYNSSSYPFSDMTSLELNFFYPQLQGWCESLVVHSRDSTYQEPPIYQNNTWNFRAKQQQHKIHDDDERSDAPIITKLHYSPLSCLVHTKGSSPSILLSPPVYGDIISTIWVEYRRRRHKKHLRWTNFSNQQRV